MGVFNVIFLLFVTGQLITCQKKITIYSVFTKDSDLDFFKNTFPWIIDNVGTDIKLDYHFKDSGKNSGPRKCVLLQLNKNAYLQAEYLRCLATGHQNTECIQSLPINTVEYNKCVKSKVNSFVKSAEREFKKIKQNTSPVILLPRKKVIDNITPQSILDSICTLYSKIKPFGCTNPKPVPQNNSDDKSEPEIENKNNKTITDDNNSSPKDKNDDGTNIIPNSTDENQNDHNSVSKNNKEKTNTEENVKSNNTETSNSTETQTSSG